MGRAGLISRTILRMVGTGTGGEVGEGAGGRRGEVTGGHLGSPWEEEIFPN